MTKLTIVTGFLGAGKTTYINEFLEHLKRRGERVIVLINDFGEESIDNSLIADGAESLGAGCVCCTLKNEFLFTLKKLLEKRPDRIVFEPSGVFMLTENLSALKGFEGLVLDSVTAIVDGQNYYIQKADFGQFIDNQIRFADRIIISKSDKSSITESVIEDIELLYGDVDIICKPYSCFADEDFEPSRPVKDFSERVAHPAPLCFSRKVNREFSEFLIKQIARNFKSGRYGNVIRAKGILNRQGGGYYLINVVSGEIAIEKLEKLTESARIAVMGETLDSSRLKGDFF